MFSPSPRFLLRSCFVILDPSSITYIQLLAFSHGLNAVIPSYSEHDRINRVIYSDGGQLWVALDSLMRVTRR